MLSFEQTADELERNRFARKHNHGPVPSKKQTRKNRIICYSILFLRAVQSIKKIPLRIHEVQKDPKVINTNYYEIRSEPSTSARSFSFDTNVPPGHVCSRVLRQMC